MQENAKQPTCNYIQHSHRLPDVEIIYLIQLRDLRPGNVTKLLRTYETLVTGIVVQSLIN